MDNMQICNGTSYNKATSVKLMQLLEQLRIAGTKVRVWYGDPATGSNWNDESNVTGTISRSTGIAKIPLLINNSRSIGGGGLLDDCIVHIVDVKTKKVLYTHKLFKMPVTIVQDRSQTDFTNTIPTEYTHCVKIDGKQHAFFKSESKAKRYADFMTGKRMNK